jgi:sulfur relay protein TusC/DsrF
MAQSILFLITRAPYGVEEAFAGLRMALAFAVNGVKTSVVMMEDGVYNAVAGQKAEVLKMPSNADATKELFDFEAQVHVVREDLKERGVAEDALLEGVKVISRDNLRKLVIDHDVLTTF